MRKGYESITEFIFMEDPVEKVDVILVPGGSHRQLMVRAAELYKAGYGKYILPSGGKNAKLVDHETEFEFLKNVALEMGIPEEAILKEDQAAHTFDNGAFSYDLLKKESINIDKVILVCKNFHSRRAFMTYKINFPPETRFIVQPVVDGTGIRKDNWMLHDDYRKKVLSEVKKIGTYFVEHLESLVSD